MLLAEAEWRMEQKLFPGAERCFAEFSCGLEAHLGEEDRIAWAVVEGASLDVSVCAERQTDHQALRRMASLAADAIHAKDPASFACAASDLRDMFASHQNQEERTVFPLLRQIGPPDAARQAREG
jgi:hypothetical protein